MNVQHYKNEISISGKGITIHVIAEKYRRVQQLYEIPADRIGIRLSAEMLINEKGELYFPTGNVDIKRVGSKWLELKSGYAAKKVMLDNGGDDEIEVTFVLPREG